MTTTTTSDTETIPATQYAVQLVGPGELTLNREKPVTRPGPHQILARIECVGLCFSDLKLLKQFSQHARKSEIVRGIDPRVLADLPSYVPGDKPTVPGHEVVCRIVAVGDNVTRHMVGERCLVQADYRPLRTAGSNGAFGYNFEGGLQEYVLLDERIVIDPHDGERYLIPAPEDLGRSQIALVEPWACVEDSYVTVERQTIKPGGRLLVVAEAGREIKGLAESFAPAGAPGTLTAVVADEARFAALKELGIALHKAASLEELPDEGFDDIVYFGADKRTLEALNDKLATEGILNVALGGERIGAPVEVGVGRVHYGMTRWVGTTGDDAAAGYARIPRTGDARDGDSVLVVGAGGPMGQMHVIRNVCSGRANLSVLGTDFDPQRLDGLERKARPMAQANGVALTLQNTRDEPLEGDFSYHALMAPVGALVEAAIQHSTPGALINIFAGIPAPVKHPLDLDVYIEKGLFMFGTSGSTIRDMKIVLGKVIDRGLDTNSSVDAICGMAGATDGIAAVENRTLAGKIVVYPMLHDVGLIPLEKLAERYPTVAARLTDGQWNAEAEAELLRVAGGD